MLLEIGPSFFLDYSDDILDGMLLVTVHHWEEGQRLLMPSFHVAFSHLSLI
jgi:hypothetical protein